MKTYKVGIIGCGRIGSLLEEDPLRGKPCTHAGGFNSVSSAKIFSGCDTDPKRLAQFGKRWGVERLYNNFREMLARESLDIVCVATWTHLHAEMVKAAVRAKVRGIFCEKPLATTLEEARSIVRLCQRKKVPLLVNHERRWDAYYLKAKRLIETGKIGEVRTVIGNCLSMSPPKLPVKKYTGGPLFHDGTHLVDLLLFFCGPVDWVSGQARRPHGAKNIEETATALLRFKNGVTGFIEGGGARKYFNFQLDIQGSEGRLLIGNDGQELFVTRKSKRFTQFHELERVDFPQPKNYQTPFVGGARDMIRCIRQGVESHSSGRDGLNAMEIIFAIYRSAAQKGRQTKVHVHSR